MITVNEELIIPTKGGSVKHICKNDSPGFDSFGEAYASIVSKDVVRAWKKHNLMILNLVVIKGEVKFVFFEEKKNKFAEIIIGDNNNKRISVQPKIWFGFKGLSENSIIVNIASIKHDPSEVDRCDLSDIYYEW